MITVTITTRKDLVVSRDFFNEYGDAAQLMQDWIERRKARALEQDDEVIQVNTVWSADTRAVAPAYYR